MTNDVLLLISPDPARVGTLRLALAGCGCPIQTTANVGLALARIGGGGVGTVVLHLAGSLDGNAAAWNCLRQLREQAPLLTVAVVGDADSGRARTQALALGASVYVHRGDEQAILAAELHKAWTGVASLAARAVRKATVIAMIGAKGGVGTTTTALNLAVALAGHGSVALAELCPAPGSLVHFFRISRPTPTLSDFEGEGSGPALATCLWSSPLVPGLDVLFGPSEGEPGGRLDSGKAASIMDGLARMTDYVVLDLPPGLSPANRILIGGSDHLGLVVEREPLCLEAAKRVASLLETVMPSATGAIVVNRTALASPAPLAEIQGGLGMPLLEIIPPASDLCVRAQRARVPLVQLDPDSLVAMSFDNLARTFQSKARTGARLAAAAR